MIFLSVERIVFTCLTALKNMNARHLWNKFRIFRFFLIKTSQVLVISEYIFFLKTMLKIMKILWSLDEVFFQLRRKMLICRNAFVFIANLISAVAIFFKKKCMNCIKISYRHSTGLYLIEAVYNVYDNATVDEQITGNSRYFYVWTKNEKKKEEGEKENKYHHVQKCKIYRKNDQVKRITLHHGNIWATWRRPTRT